MTHLNFDVGQREVDPAAEPITFTLNGRNGRKETFTLVEKPSIMPVLALGASGDLDVDSMDEEEVSEAMGALYDFFRAVLEPRDWRRFRRTAVRFSLDQHDLLPILTGLVTAIYARPTVPPSGSPPSPSPAGTSSMAASLSPAAATQSS